MVLVFLLGWITVPFFDTAMPEAQELLSAMRLLIGKKIVNIFDIGNNSSILGISSSNVLRLGKHSNTTTDNSS